MPKISTILMAASAIACATDPGTRPHDMSAAQHQSAATQEGAAAHGHESQFDATATEESTVCGQASGQTTGTRADNKPPPCWTSRSNPTAQHREDAARHRELAAKHRAASAALVQAEQRACTGIPSEDVDMSPFNRGEDIVSVGTVEVNTPYVGQSSPDRAIGARVVFRAVPGLTAEWFQHTLKCHIARAAAAGHEMPEMSYCPLALKGVQASVSSAGDGLAVTITSNDPPTAQEIVRRVHALRSKPQ